MGHCHVSVQGRGCGLSVCVGVSDGVGDYVSVGWVLHVIKYLELLGDRMPASGSKSPPRV